MRAEHVEFPGKRLRLDRCGRQLFQNRAAPLPTLAQGPEQFLERLELANARSDVANVIVEQEVELAAVLPRSVFQTQQASTASEIP